ncbi:MAG: hypothetical protein ACLQAT_15660 [Candidatus Binataceae bacterium]
MAIPELPDSSSWREIVELIEERVPGGKVISTALIALSLLYAFLWLLTRLATQFLIPLANYLHGVLVGGSYPALPIPFSSLGLLSWALSAALLGVLGYLIFRWARGLEQRVTALQRLNTVLETIWFPPTVLQRQEAAALLKKLGVHSVQFQHTGQPDCYEFAIELADIFKAAGWSVFLFDNKPTTRTARGITFQGRADDSLPNAARDALIRITGQAMTTKSEHYVAAGDITVVIGPRKMRGGEWL